MTADFDRQWDLYREQIAKTANLAMRDHYLSSDANIGSEILKARKKGLSSQNMFLLRQQWSPISWERKAGLHFAIAEISMMALGQSALDPEIDQIVTDAAADALAENFEGILEGLIQDVITGDASNYEIRDIR